MRTALLRSSIPLALICCAGPARPQVHRDDAPGQATEPPAWTDETRAKVVAIHMRDHYDDLRVIERHLVDGDLDTVREYAFGLALDKGDPEISRWDARFGAMREAAYKLGSAAGLDEAAQREAQLAATCGSCHRETGAIPTFEPPPVPPDEPTALARMDRHQWAADRLWQAMITSADDAWRDGLDVLAVTPLPDGELTAVAAPSAKPAIRDLAESLQRLAKSARGAATLDERATRYGEILGVCVRCHAAAK